MISKNSSIHKSAKIGKGVEIGDYCVIGENVEIGDYCKIYNSVCISGNTKIGKKILSIHFVQLEAILKILNLKVKKVF
jgi:UDP-N-acetylglucosamine acyltransferase